MIELARVGGSSAERLIACPGSVALCASVPSFTDGDDDEYAGPGRVAHKVAEKCLLTGYDVETLVGRTIEVDGKTFEIEPDMLPVQLYVDEIRKHLTDAVRDTIKIEHEVSLELFDPILKGRADCFFLDPETGILWLFDLKYGAGVSVEVEDNEQFLFYDLGALLHFDNLGVPVKLVRHVVVQPRCDHDDGPVRDQDVDPEDLIAFGFKLAAAIETARQPNAPTKTGKHCQFCAAKKALICPALNAVAEQAVEFEKLDTIAADLGVELDPDEVGQRMALVEPLKAWLAAVRRYGWNESQRGRIPTGYKLVGVKGRRKFLDGDLVMRQVKRDMPQIDEETLYRKKPLSPNQLEKLLGKKVATPFVDAHASKRQSVALVPLSDEREAVQPSLMTDFADIIEEGANGQE